MKSISEAAGPATAGLLALLFAASIVLTGCEEAEEAPRMSLEDILDIRHPTAPVWSPDGDEVFFVWDLNQQMDLYAVKPGSGEPPRQLTRWGDSYEVIGGLFWGGDTDLLHFTRNGRLYQMDPDLAGTLRAVFHDECAPAVELLVGWMRLKSHEGFEDGVVPDGQDDVGIPAVHLHAEALGQLGLLDLAGDSDAPLPDDIGRLHRQVRRRVVRLTADGADPLQGQDRKVEGGAQLFQPQDVVVLQGLFDPPVTALLHDAPDFNGFFISVRLDGIVKEQDFVAERFPQLDGHFPIGLHAPVGMVLAADESLFFHALHRVGYQVVDGAAAHVAVGGHAFPACAEQLVDGETRTSARKVPQHPVDRIQ